MADKRLRTMVFPGLEDTYTIPQDMNDLESIEAVAEPYDEFASYAIGDYCSNGGKFYRCNTAIPSGETWNANHWTETNVGDEILAEKVATSTALSGKVSKAGDTMTGALTISSTTSAAKKLTIKDTLADIAGGVPDSNRQWTVEFIDKNSLYSGWIQNIIYGSNGSYPGRSSFILGTRKKINGSLVDNSVNLLLESDGTRGVVVSSAEAWRSALGLNTYPNFAPGTAIPSNSNLNSYRTAGTFYVQTDAVAATISNIPYSASGTLMVINRGDSNNYCTQIYLPTTNKTLIYVRNYNNGSWTNWARTVNSENKELTLTRTENELQTAVDFARMHAFSWNGMLMLLVNSGFTAGKTTSDFVEIGRISDWSAVSSCLVNVPAQSSTHSICTFSVSTSGVISVYFSGQSLGTFYRTVINVPHN